MRYLVYSRYGWGWQVQGQDYQSYPFESAIDAQLFADCLNSGSSISDALNFLAPQIEFNNGRFYHKDNVII